MTQPPRGQQLPRLRGRGSDSAETRRLILEAAARLFSERGYATAALSDLVAAAGVTKGAVYWHFKSKEEIALDIVRQMYASWPTLVNEAVDGSANALEALVAVTYTAGRQFSDDPVAHAGKRLLAELPADALAKLPQPYVTWQTALTHLIAEGQTLGQINKHIDAAVTAQVIVASFFGMQQVSHELTNRQDLESRIDGFWQLVRPQLTPT